MSEQGLMIPVRDDSAVHDLDALAEGVRREYFPSAPRLVVRWGRRVEPRRRQSIRLGSYDYSTATIRIHPFLDSARIPAWFIQSVIHHEYLHHLIGPNHNRRFQRYERTFRYYRESKTWLRRYLPVLLGRARPRPLREIRSLRAAPVSPAADAEQTSLF